MTTQKNPASLTSEYRALKQISCGNETPKNIHQNKLWVNNTALFSFLDDNINPVDFPILFTHWSNVSGVSQ